MSVIKKKVNIDVDGSGGLDDESVVDGSTCPNGFFFF
jgi:hypothetical protein